MRGYGLKPRVGTGGRGEKNRRQIHAAHFHKILGGFFHNHVGGQHPVCACGLRIVGKFLEAVAQNRIQIAENHQARRGSGSANLAGQDQHIFESRSVSQGALHGTLDDGAVGERIAERYAQFDHVCARVNGRNSNLARGLERRVACGQIDHQTRLVIETNRH